MRFSMAALVCMLAACGGDGRLEPCEVASAECQEDVFYAVVRMRGDGFDPFGGIPPIRTITLDEYRDELQGDQADPPLPPDDDTMDDMEPEDTRSPQERAFDTALTLLGLLAPTTSSGQAAVDDAVSNVVAFYSGGSGKVTVIDRGGEPDLFASTATLAHELIHAFQGREPPVGGGDGSLDDAFARRALIEGEAELYEQLAAVEMAERQPEDLDWMGFYGSWIDKLREDIGESKRPFFRVSRGFAYPLGANRMLDAWFRGGNVAVRRVFENRPTTSQFFMATGTGVEQRKPVATRCAADPPSLGGTDGEEMKSYFRDRFGAAQLYGFLAKQTGEDDGSWEQALDWQGDSLRIYGDEEGEVVALSWRILLRDDTAEAVAEVLPESDEVRVFVDGRHLVVHASNDAEILAEWRGATDCE
ncbi:MAG: hypothetical protein PVI30_25595 [Myxococcales bacterium]|jgi:hypothetical protein